MGYEHILVDRSGDFATVTMNRPQRRNSLSQAHMRELISRVPGHRRQHHAGRGAGR